MGLYAVQQALAAVARGLTGMRRAPDNPTESAASYPFANVYPISGRWASNDASYKTGFQTFRVDIYLGKLPDVGRKIKEHSSMIEEFASAIYADPQLDGTCESVDEIRWTLMEQTLGADRELILRYEIDVKYQSTNV